MVNHKGLWARRSVYCPKDPNALCALVNLAAGFVGAGSPSRGRGAGTAPIEPGQRLFS